MVEIEEHDGFPRSSFALHASLTRLAASTMTTKTTTTDFDVNPSGGRSRVSTRTASPQLSGGKFFSRHVKLSPGIIEADTIEGFIFPALGARRARLINHRQCRRNETGLWTCIETGCGKLVPHEWPSSTDSSSDVAWKNSMHWHPGNRSVRSVSFDPSFPLLKILHGKSQFASQPQRLDIRRKKFTAEPSHRKTVRGKNRQLSRGRYRTENGR